MREAHICGARTPEERHDADGEHPEVGRDDAEVEEMGLDEDQPVTTSHSVPDVLRLSVFESSWRGMGAPVSEKGRDVGL